MASPYETAVTALTPTSQWLFRETGSGTAAAIGTSAVSGTYSGSYLQQVVSPLARDTTTTVGPYGSPIAGVHFIQALGGGGIDFTNTTFPFGTTTTFSISMLFRIRSDATLAEMRLMDKSFFNGSIVQGWALTIDPAGWRVIFQRWDASGTNVNSYSGPLTPQVWYHLLVTYDGSTQRLYLDGAIQNTVADTGSVSTTSAVCTIGYSSGRGGYHFDGEIGPSAVWTSTVLTQGNATTLANAAFLATGTAYTLGTVPCATIWDAGGVMLAGDTLTVPYNSGTAHIETQSRFQTNSSAFKYPGTKWSPITVISDQPFPYTLKPVIQWGDGTHDLRGQYKLNMTEQAWVNVIGLRLTQFGAVTSTFDDRLYGAWSGLYGTQVREIQTITTSGTGSFTLHFPGSFTTATLTQASTAATVQTALQDAAFAQSDFDNPLFDCIVTGTFAGGMAIQFGATAGTWPYSQGPMVLITANVVSGTPGLSITRTRAWSNSTRWFQNADFCLLSYCSLDNCFQPMKCSRATGVIMEYCLITGANVGIGCFNARSPIFRYNVFECNVAPASYGQDCSIQSKGGTTNARIYGNRVHVPAGATPMSVGIYLGGGSNDTSGFYDPTTSGYESYNTYCVNNIVHGELGSGTSFSFGGICNSGGTDCLTDHNIVIDAAVAFRAMTTGEDLPNLAWRPLCNNPTITNNVALNCTQDFAYNLGVGDVTGTLVFDYNYRYGVTTRTAQTHTPVGDQSSGNVSPGFRNIVSDWRLPTSSPLRRKGTVATLTAYGSGYDAGARDVSHDYTGVNRYSPSDLGIYESGTVPRLRPRR